VSVERRRQVQAQLSRPQSSSAGQRSFWASRPLATSVLRNKPVAVVGASAGAFGAIWAQAELRKLLAATGARVIDAEVAVGHAANHFDGKGQLADDSPREQLAEVIQAIAAQARPLAAAA